MNEYEKLILLIEECAEVQHSATKCLRFGKDHDEPGYGNNWSVLSKELGELEAVSNSLKLDRPAFNRGYNNKMDRVEELFIKHKNNRPQLQASTHDA